MPLNSGTKVGGYQIVALIGAGGMGEVYRGRDTRLNRDVAIKILPEALAGDSERIARFQREATVLASLNHPNIAHIYGFEQAGEVGALILELVEGPTLADRIAQGPIPVDDALAIAKQTVDALEAAHEQGIIHRDLKPANIKLRFDGVVKVLDFGLAKAMSATETGHGSVRLQADLSASPTITSPLMTGQGLILGTAAYMSPEQARGKAVDKRSDVWAFGCVLYEMLTGKRAFEGDEVTDVLAFIITKEPDYTALPPRTPHAIRKLLNRCLAKDRKKRLADVADARLELEEALTVPGVDSPAAAVRSAFSPVRVVALIVLTAIMSALISGVATWFVVRRTPAGERSVQRFTIQPPASAPYTARNRVQIAISRDGSRLVYSALQNGKTMLYVRDLSELEPQPIRGSEDAIHPFLSPDGESVGFFTEATATSGKLKKVAVRGGVATTLCEAPAPHGGAWAEDGTIVFAASVGGNRAGGGLFKVSAAGGQPEPLTTVDPKTEARHGWPDVLPGGKGILLSVLPQSGMYDSGRIAVHAAGSTRTIVESGYQARYLSSGHILYLEAGSAVDRANLMVVPFDSERLTIKGAPVRLVENVRVGPRSVGSAGFGVASTGLVVYASGEGPAAKRGLVWVDRKGHEEPLTAPQRAYTYLRLSPDATRVVLDVRDEASDIWVWSLSRQTLTRVTKDPAIDRFPVWSPDGTRVLYSSSRGGAIDNIYSQAADGSGEPERLFESELSQSAQTFTTDGSQLIVLTNGALKVLQLAGKRMLRPLIQPPGNERNAEMSPDGQWLAYQSNESGRDEVYVRPFPSVNAAKFQVSTAGGSRPLWSQNGNELFYIAGTNDESFITVMAVPVEARPAFSAGVPNKLFEGRYLASDTLFVGRSYDVSPDGKKFLMIREQRSSDSSESPLSFVVLLNLPDELKRVAPAVP